MKTAIIVIGTLGVAALIVAGMADKVEVQVACVGIASNGVAGLCGYMTHYFESNAKGEQG